MSPIEAPRSEKRPESAPGRFTDLHIHGAFGVDIVTADARELDRMAEGLYRRGYASFLPTLVPQAESETDRTLDRLLPWIESRRDAPREGIAVPCGVHFEGPFVSPGRAGALQIPHLRRADDENVHSFLRRVDSVPGRVMVTLAPEVPGALDLIGELDARGALVSIGHTDATWDELDRAVERGARHMTHFCNAMRPLHHREPGPVGFGLMRRDITIDVIADGIHVDRRMLELIVRARGGEGVALISDAMPAAGLGDGDYQVWGEILRVRDGQARNAAGDLAGSTALLDECVAVAGGLDVAGGFDVDAAASTLPRAILEAEATT